MRVKDIIRLYEGMSRIDVEIYASVTVFNMKHLVLVDAFKIDCSSLYGKNDNDFLYEEAIGFDIVQNKLRINIKGDRES